MAAKIRGPASQRRALHLLFSTFAQLAPGGLDVFDVPTDTEVDSPVDEATLSAMLDVALTQVESDDMQLSSEERA